MDASSSKIIDGELFEALVTAGAASLKANKKAVNDLNVFPIPDGDTGDNMYLTLNGGIGAMKSEKSGSLSDKAKALAHGMLLNARGNSGVILSQFFFGIANGLCGKDKANAEDFAAALLEGVKQSYSSVLVPVEGTVLTVAKDAANYTDSMADGNTSVGVLLKACVEEMKRSLERTPTLLEVLMEAGVVDSGGAGLVAIFEGMLAYAKGEKIDTSYTEDDTPGVDFSKFTEDSVMVYGYCTEFLLQLQRIKVDPDSFDISIITEYLESIGDSIVAFKTGSVVKVHVHTMTPYKALEFCQKYGEFLTVKIENMTLQHNETGDDFATKKAKKPRAPHKKFSLVTVATGKGLTDTFHEFGADIVIDGGQGKNPSIERFIDAFDEANAHEIFVLPNNSNIIMAAKQAADMYKGSKIHVIETKSFGEAYSILSMLDYSADDGEAIAEAMRENMTSSVTGMITGSIRSVTLDGVDVKEGDYIGFTNKTMLASASDKVKTFELLLEKLSADEKEFLILFSGEGATDEEFARVEEFVAERYPNLEFYAVNGGQEIYDFILILE